jgi:hypothetical protein
MTIEEREANQPLDDDDEPEIDGSALAIVQIMARLAAMPQNRFLTMHELRELAERGDCDGGKARARPQNNAVATERVNRSSRAEGSAASAERGGPFLEGKRASSCVAFVNRWGERGLR